MESWDDLRYLLAVSRAGSLAGAARALHVDATTVGRRLAALERSLGTRLLLRGTRVLTLTAAAEAVVARAAAVEDAVRALEGTAGEGDAALTGPVRLTASDEVAAHLLAPQLPAFHARYPGLELQLVVSTEVLDLERREADVALRLTAPRGGSLVARRIGELAFAWYAGHDYLVRHGAPGEGRMAGHRVLLWETGTTSAEQHRLLKASAGARVVLRSNRSAVLREAAAAGLGIAALPCLGADADPRLARLDPQPVVSRPLWLVMHRDLQRTARLRAVANWLVELTRAERERLAGRAPPRVPQR